MKHPVWMINSSLVLVLTIILIFIFFSRQQPPPTEDIEPTPPAAMAQTISSVNLEKIWQNDLFDTYQKPAPVEEEAPPLKLPPPPKPQPVVIPEMPTPQFLDPLDITLKGIMIIVNNDSLNRAIILDNKTQQEASYKVGDHIEDAQLVKIMSNKVVLIRSNGQQEVLYLREKDARQDPTYAVMSNWSEVVQKISENKYMVSKHAFVSRVTSLAQFIDMLDLTTVYQQGVSIGCRIGDINPTSLGSALGFKRNDIILSVNGISAGDTTNRFGIYKMVSNLSEQDIINVKLLRNNQEINNSYILHEFAPKSSEEIMPAKAGTTPEQSSMQKQAPTKLQQKEQLKILQEQHKLAPTVKEIRAQERKNMANFGRISGRQPTYKLTGTTP